MDIVNFLKELRESSDIQFNVFTKGSCFRLYKILKVVFPKAEAYWSDRDNHCITKINKEYYDIGGKINPKYVEEAGYYKIPSHLEQGYALLKHSISEEADARVVVERYV